MTTEKLVLEMKAEAAQLKRELDAVNKKIKTAEESTKDYREENEKTEDGMKSLAGKAGVLAKGIAGAATAVTAATAAFVAYATAQGRAIQETQALATMAGVTVEEFKRLSFVYGTVGVSAEKFGDITKDVQERIGEFQNAGTGAFQDVADALGLTSDEALALSSDFEKMSGQEVLQEVVNRMEDAGKSSQQMSAVLEALASDTTRLIPLLQDGGKAANELKEQFDNVNVELSPEERQQFADLANDVDMAQTAFVNWINNGIAPFLPLIGDAAIALSEFFASAQAGSDLEDIYDNPELVKSVQSLEQLEQLERRLAKESSDAAQSRNDMISRNVNMSEVANKQYEKERKRLAEISKVIAEQREKIEQRNAALTKTPEIQTGTATTVTGGGDGAGATGVDQATLKAELEAYQDSKRSKLQVLEDERTDALAVAATMAEDSQERADLELEIQQRYNEKSAALKAEEQAVTDALNTKKEEARQKEIDGIKAELQAYEDSQLTKLELLRKEEEEKLAIIDANAASEEERNAMRLEVERSYQEQRRAIIDELSPETFDNEIVQERYDAELEQLKEHLNNKLLSEEEYLTKVNDLKKKSAEDDKKTTDSVVKWEGTATKKQIDQGIQLLDAVGGNSKKLFRVKQGLSAANAVMNTAEGVTDALAQQNYPSAAVIAATGVTQLSAIMSASPDGGSGTISAPTASAPAASAVEDTGTSATVSIDDIGEATTQRMVLEFNDDIIDVIAKKVDQSKQDGRT